MYFACITCLERSGHQQQSPPSAKSRNPCTQRRRSGQSPREHRDREALVASALMDSSRKRKAGADQGLNGASKRQKIPSESPESTTQAGLQLIDALRNAKDKTGRSITTLFRTLPDKRELPEYYQTIKLPIAIDTVESKLRRHAYPTLTTVESDFKRMVANAKLFNDDKSIVFADAERVRKLLSNWMKAHNPAYQDPDYSAFPTPLPGEDGANSAASPTPAAAVADTGERPKKPTITLSRGRKQSIPPEPVAPEAATDAVDFAGKTFQQAQEQIIQELIDYVDDECVSASHHYKRS